MSLHIVGSVIPRYQSEEAKYVPYNKKLGRYIPDRGTRNTPQYRGLQLTYREMVGDISFSVKPYMKSHTGATMSILKFSIFLTSIRKYQYKDLYRSLYGGG